MFEPPAREQPKAAPSPLTGRGVLVAAGLFFGAIVTANGALTYAALSTLPGGELANSYDASQGYNRHIAAARAQDARGWRAEARATPEASGARIAVTLKDRDNVVVEDLQVVARLEHPADARADRQALLVRHGAVYEAVVAPARSGRWTLRIIATRAGEQVFVSEQRINLASPPVSGS